MSVPAIPPFAYGHDGALLVTTDGAELLVHNGADEAPIWKRTAPGPIMGVGITRRAVVAVDDAGHLLEHARDRGQIVRERDLGLAARGLAASATGVIAAWGEGAAVIVPESGEPRRIAFEGIAAIALDARGSRLAAGSESGELRVLDTSSGALLGSSPLGAPVRGVGWSSRGVWIVAVAGGLVQVSADGREVKRLLDTGDLELGSLSCSANGALVAVRAGEHKAAVFDLVGLEFQGAATYERTVGQVDFGPGACLGVGLDRGDANKIELTTNAVSRTDPHEGRKRNTWVLLSDFKREPIGRLMRPSGDGVDKLRREADARLREADARLRAASVRASRPPAGEEPGPGRQGRTILALLVVGILVLGLVVALLRG